VWAVELVGTVGRPRRNELAGNKAFYVGRKFCADEGGKWKCNRGAVGGWEKFQIADIGGGRVAIKGGKNKKWCADEGNTIKCNRGGIGAWEKFYVKHMSGNKFYLRGGRNNKWCKYYDGNVKCDRPKWNKGTKFRYKNW